MITVENKLKEIIDFSIERRNKFNLISEIELVEQELGTLFPKEYKAFLLNYPGCYIKDEYAYKPIDRNPMSPKDGYSSTDYFYGKDIQNAISTYFKDELNEELIPICDIDGGSLICINITKENYGKIYYWSHDENDNLKDCLFLIQNSFEDFIMSFEYHKNESSVNLDDIKITLDPSLL